MKNNLINIISVSDGNENDLKLTIQSVKSQIYTSYSHIIIAKKLSKKFILKNKSNRIMFIVGKDKSIYNAMNIGESKSYKNHTIYLNSGDIFFSKKSLSVINKKLISRCNFNGQFISILRYRSDFFYPKKSFFFNKNTLTHSSFVRSPRNKDQTIFYNEKHIITADGTWMKKNIKLNGLRKIYFPITIFTLDGISTLPTFKTIVIKGQLGIIDLAKETIKYILLKLVGKHFYYRLIYLQKYDLKNEKIYK